MIKIIENTILTLKQLRFYNIHHVIQYLQLRYEVFLSELNRNIFDEFNTNDIIANHYILMKNTEVIGLARVLYKENYIAEIGRVAIKKFYRSQGYGSIIINQLIDTIKKNNKISAITLFTEDEKISFYKKLGFKENGKIFLGEDLLMRMIISIK